MSYDAKELRRANQVLAASGVPHPLEDLGNDPRLFQADYVEPLFDLLKRRWKHSYVEMHAIRALSQARLGKEDRRRTVAACIAVLRARADPNDVDLGTIASSLIGLADTSSIPELGELALDPRYGELRVYLLYSLSKVKNPAVVRILEAAIEDPQTRLEAFRRLAERDPAGTLRRMAPWLDKNCPYPGEFRKLHQRLRRKVEGFTAASAPHRFKGRFPRNLPWWSTNIDAEDLKPYLVAAGLPAEMHLEVEGAIADLSSGKRIQFAFPQQSLWLEVRAEDEDAYILKILAATQPQMHGLQPHLEEVSERLDAERERT